MIVEVKTHFTFDTGLYQAHLHAVGDGQARVSICVFKHLLQCSQQCIMWFILHICAYLFLISEATSERICSRATRYEVDLGNLGHTGVSKLAPTFG